jgi:Fe2+ transport system protein FeoA
LNKQHSNMMVVNCRESHIALREEEAQCIHVCPVKD